MEPVNGFPFIFNVPLFHGNWFFSQQIKYFHSHLSLISVLPTNFSCLWPSPGKLHQIASSLKWFLLLGAHLKYLRFVVKWIRQITSAQTENIN